MRLFKQPYRWIAFSKSAKFLIPRNLSLLPDSRLWSIETCGNAFCVKYLYKYSKADEKYVERNVATWSEGEGLKFFEDSIFFGRKRSDLNGTLIQISYVVTKNETLHHLWDYRSDRVVRFQWALNVSFQASPYRRNNEIKLYLGAPSHGFCKRKQGVLHTAHLGLQKYDKWHLFGDDWRSSERNR